MDRSIVYPQEQGRSTDFLFAQRAAMIGLSKLAAALLGASTCVNGLACTATSPASLDVNIAQGEIYSMADVDASSYGVLPADTSDIILKQGISMATTTLACPAPATTGYSINYLIEAIYQDSDTNNVVLPYFNSANPSQPFTGQSNSGAPQPTQRQGLCVLAVKAGAAAPSGTQTTPAPDAGYTGLWVVTVANGQTAIASGNIAQYPGAPFLTVNLGNILTGLPGYAQLAAAQAWTAAQRGAFVPVQPVAVGATLTLNFALGNNFVVGGGTGVTSAIGASFVLGTPSNLVPGQSGVITFLQNATGGYTISSRSASWVGANGTRANLTAGANGRDDLFYVVDFDGKIILSAAGNVS
jgi:hypothetical protein